MEDQISLEEEKTLCASALSLYLQHKRKCVSLGRPLIFQPSITTWTTSNRARLGVSEKQRKGKRRSYKKIRERDREYGETDSERKSKARILKCTDLNAWPRHSKYVVILKLQEKQWTVSRIRQLMLMPAMSTQANNAALSLLLCALEV